VNPLALTDRLADRAIIKPLLVCALATGQQRPGPDINTLIRTWHPANYLPFRPFQLSLSPYGIFLLVVLMTGVAVPLPGIGRCRTCQLVLSVLGVDRETALPRRGAAIAVNPPRSCFVPLSGLGELARTTQKQLTDGRSSIVMLRLRPRHDTTPYQ
jgi:hypothetical protein